MATKKRIDFTTRDEIYRSVGRLVRDYVYNAGYSALDISHCVQGAAIEASILVQIENPEDASD
jgi:hypothetical protein